MNKIVEAYEKHKNLKLAACELGMKWQTLYVQLKKLGIPITGDKLRYGSDSDRLAARAELLFAELVPNAINNNEIEFQSKLDFSVGRFGVDVKASRLAQGNKNFAAKRWAFSVKKQEFCADFIVCFGIKDDGYSVFLIPGEIIKNYQSISIAPNGKGKWLDYEVSPKELSEFFSMIVEP